MATGTKAERAGRAARARNKPHGVREAAEPSLDPASVPPESRPDAPEAAAADEELDRALLETFPASDPVSINPGADPGPSASRRGRQGAG